MRILNVTAQKPNSTGSGIFLSGLMTEFANKGHTQALVAGVYPEEETPVPDRVTFYPVYFEGETELSDCRNVRGDAISEYQIPGYDTKDGSGIQRKFYETAG